MLRNILNIYYKCKYIYKSYEPHLHGGPARSGGAAETRDSAQSSSCGRNCRRCDVRDVRSRSLTSAGAVRNVSPPGAGGRTSRLALAPALYPVQLVPESEKTPEPQVGRPYPLLTPGLCHVLRKKGARGSDRLGGRLHPVSIS